jgi:hypothetical protein
VGRAEVVTEVLRTDAERQRCRRPPTRAGLRLASLDGGRTGRRSVRAGARPPGPPTSAAAGFEQRSSRARCFKQPFRVSVVYAGAEASSWPLLAGGAVVSEGQPGHASPCWTAPGDPPGAPASWCAGERAARRRGIQLALGASVEALSRSGAAGGGRRSRRTRSGRRAGGASFGANQPACDAAASCASVPPSRSRVGPSVRRRRLRQLARMQKAGVRRRARRSWPRIPPSARREAVARLSTAAPVPSL